VTATAKPTGTCPICNQTRALKKDGTMRNHGICKGAGQKPKEQ
jgi:hypothetical protein